MATEYIHGYSEKEQQRLISQAAILEEPVFGKIDLSKIKNLLEPGIGVGAEAAILLKKYPDLKITGVDISPVQLGKADKYLSSLKFAKGRFNLIEMDATSLAFKEHAKFDGAFVCWVLEHVPDPLGLLVSARANLLTGSEIFITEVQNSTLYLYPPSPAIMRYWELYIQIQQELNGDPFVGSKLGNLLSDAGFRDIQLLPFTFLYGKNEPEKRNRMLKYWEELLLSGAESLVNSGKLGFNEIDLMKEDFNRLFINNDTIFHYSFIQAIAKA